MSAAEPSVPPRDATARVRTLVCLALLAAAATRFATRTFGEPEFDVWWMLVVGRVAGLRASFADTLSFTAPGVLHHNHSYLHCALLATIERLGGLAGVWGLKVALAGGLTAAVVVFLRQRVRDPLALLVLGTLGYGVFVVPWLLMRPQLWTYLGVFALLVLMQRERNRSGWLLLLAVPLLGVWQGLHGAAALGVVFLAVEAAGSSVGWFERRPSLAHALPRWAALGGVAVVLFLAPYSVLGVVGEKLGSLGAFPTTEWLPVWNLAAFQVAFPGVAGVVAAGAMAGAVVAAAVVLVAARHVRGGGYQREAVFLLVALVLALRMIRNLPVLGLALVVLLAKPVDAFAGEWWRRARRAPAYGRLSAASLACGTVVLAAIAMTHVLDPVGPDPFRFPVAACAWLAHEHPEGGNLLTDDPRGSYATWCLSRTWRVSIDGREELLYPAPVLIDHRTLAGPPPQAAEVVARWRPDAILLPTEVPLAHASAAPSGYTERYRDAHFVVWTKDATRAVVPNLLPHDEVG